MYEHSDDKASSILHLGKFYPPHRGGMETHLHDLAVRQARVASVGVVVANDSTRSEASEIECVRVYRVPKLGTIASMPVCPTLAKAIRRCPAEIVHMHVPNPGAALAFLASGHSGKLVVTHHADTLGRNIIRRLSDPFVRRCMQRASRIIVTSAGYLNSSDELAPFREKCRVIPLGIDPHPYLAENLEESKRVRQQFGERLILAVGRLVPYKGFDILIRSMRQVDGKLILIGEGPLASSLAALVRAEGMLDKVIMLGRIENLDPYFGAASLLVLPSISRAEAFGLVQLEAMAIGVPVINTSVDSGVPEVSLDGKTGITVRPGDVNSLAQAMRQLLERRDLREAFGEAARKRFRTEFTADLMAERTLAVYEEVIRSSL